LAKTAKRFAAVSAETKQFQNFFFSLVSVSFQFCGQFGIRDKILNEYARIDAGSSWRDFYSNLHPKDGLGVDFMACYGELIEEW